MRADASSAPATLPPSTRCPSHSRRRCVRRWSGIVSKPHGAEEERHDRAVRWAAMPSHDATMPVHYDLHGWLWKPNPSRLFAPFNRLSAVLTPLVVAVASILNTFSLVWALTYITDVSIIVQFLIALVGLGVAIDYALLMIFRFRDELREENDVESALVETMTHAGHSVIVSGTTVAVGLLSMIVLPLPLLRSMGIGGMLIPVVSVLTTLTLLPAMLAVLGSRINRFRVMPRRLVDHGHPEDGAWGR